MTSNYPVKINSLDQFRVTFDHIIMCGRAPIQLFAVRNSFMVPIDCGSHTRRSSRHPWRNGTSADPRSAWLISQGKRWAFASDNTIGHSLDSGQAMALHSSELHVRTTVRAPTGFCCFGCAGMLGCGQHQLLFFHWILARSSCFNGLGYCFVDV